MFVEFQNLRSVRYEAKYTKYVSDWSSSIGCFAKGMSSGWLTEKNFNFYSMLWNGFFLILNCAEVTNFPFWFSMSCAIVQFYKCAYFWTRHSLSTLCLLLMATTRSFDSAMVQQIACCAAPRLICFFVMHYLYFTLPRDVWSRLFEELLESSNGRRRR